MTYMVALHMSPQLLNCAIRIYCRACLVGEALTRDTTAPLIASPTKVETPFIIRQKLQTASADLPLADSGQKICSGRIAQPAEGGAHPPATFSGPAPQHKTRIYPPRPQMVHLPAYLARGGDDLAPALVCDASTSMESTEVSRVPQKGLAGRRANTAAGRRQALATELTDILTDLDTVQMMATELKLDSSQMRKVF